MTSHPNSPVHKAWHSTLGRRLISQTIIFSSVITFLITFTQLYYAYKEDLSTIDATVLEMQQSRAKGIVESIWVFDNEQLDIQLRGIVNTDEIFFAQIIDKDGQITASAGNLSKQNNIENEFTIPLKKKRGDEWVDLGVLQVLPDLDAVYQRLTNQAILSIASNGIKTLLVACFFVTLFYLKIGRHLTLLAQQAASYRPGIKKFTFKLPRKPDTNLMGDELEVLRQALNTLVQDCEQQRLRHASLEQEAVKSRDALSAANKEMEEFTHRTSHDLRAPIVSSLAIIQMAEELREAGELEELKEVLEMTTLSLTTLKETVDNIVEMARSKEVVEKPIPVNVNDIIDHCTSMFSHLPGAKNIQLIKSLQFNDPLTTKLTRLRNIIENLISNAIKYHNPAEETPTIWLSTQKISGKFVLTVEDNGLGIPEEHEQELFTHFKRFHSDISFGSGLGMHLIQTSAESIGGIIRYERPLSSGCRFILEIPLNDSIE